MKNSSEKGKSLPLLLVSLALAFCLVGWAYISNNSVAWFSRSSQANATGLPIEVGINGPIKVTIEAYTVIDKVDNNLYFSRTPEEEAVIPKYDILDEKSRHLLLRVRIPEEKKLLLTAETETDYFMDRAHPLLGTADGTCAGTDHNHDNCMSSIIRMKHVSAVEATHNSQDAYAVEMPEGMLAFDPENETGRSLELVNGPYTEVFVLLSYHEENINRIYSENIGNEIFMQDFTMKNGVIWFMDFHFNLSTGV